MRALFREEVKPRLAKRAGGRRLQPGNLSIRSAPMHVAMIGTGYVGLV